MNLSVLTPVALPPLQVVWTDPRPTRRSLELAPGIWITRFSEWLPANVLDTNAVLPLEVDTSGLKGRLLSFIPDWHEHAACRYGDPADFGLGEDDDEDVQQPLIRNNELREIRAVCAVCPVVIDCLEHALLTWEKVGLWAGTSARQRERMLLRAKREGIPLRMVMGEWLNELLG